MKRKNYKGMKFDYWKVLEFNEEKHMWECECVCGTRRLIESYTLNNGLTKSCGCMKNSFISEKNGTHHMTGTRPYRIYRTMITRCYNKNSHKYPRYGGRGIAVCDEWRNDFMAFYNWSMANGYADNLTIDRKDNDGNYEPDNCRWTTDAIQANNKESNRNIECFGRVQTLQEWANETGITRESIAYRLNHGWNIERALTEQAIIGKNQYS